MTSNKKTKTLKTVGAVREREREREHNFNKLSIICRVSKTIFANIRVAVLVDIKKIKFNRININKKDGLCTSIKAGM